MHAADQRRARPPLATWITRRGSLPVILAVAGFGVAAATLSAALGTPQISGAEAPLSLSAAFGAVAGFCFGFLGESRESLLEARATRNLQRRRQLLALALLTLIGAVIPLGGLQGWDWDAYRNVMVMAGSGILLVRFAGSVVAAVLFAAYMGASLFVGAPLNAPVRWWAVLLQSTDGPSIGILVATVLAIGGVLLAMRSPRVRGLGRR